MKVKEKETTGFIPKEILTRKAKNEKLTNAEIAEQIGVTEDYVARVLESAKEEKKTKGKKSQK